MLIETNTTETLLTTTNKIAYIQSIIQPVFSKIIIAIIVLLIGLIIGKIFGNILQKVLYEAKLNNAIKKITGLRIRLEEFIGKIVMYGIFFITIIFALDILQLSKFIVETLGIIVLFIIGASFVLAVKDFLPNLVSGLIIARKKLIQENDQVEINSITGRVILVELLETKIETKTGDILYVPNTMITNKLIKRNKRKI